MENKIIWEKIDGGREYWSPKVVGEELTGEVIEITRGQYGASFVIRTQKGDITTPSHKILQSLLQNIAVGDIIKITYLGEQAPKVRGEFPTKLYEVQRQKIVTEEFVK